MKKGVILALLAVSLSGWSDGWGLPVTTLRYEIAEGRTEDPDDETLDPTSLRHTVTLQVREASDFLTLWLTLRGATKDYYEQTGDWSYWQVEHEGSFRVTDSLKLGYTLSAKDVLWADPAADGSSKDTLYLNGAATAALAVAKGTTIDAAVGGRFALAVDPTGSQETLVMSAGVSSRLGEWLLGARCRAQLRAPLGVEGNASPSSWTTGSVSLQWDPNR
jgi:hypothetical protein